MESLGSKLELLSLSLSLLFLLLTAFGPCSPYYFSLLTYIEHASHDFCLGVSISVLPCHYSLPLPTPTPELFDPHLSGHQWGQGIL